MSSVFCFEDSALDAALADWAKKWPEENNGTDEAEGQQLAAIIKGFMFSDSAHKLIVNTFESTNK